MRLCRPATAWEAVSAPPFHSNENDLSSLRQKAYAIAADDAQHALRVAGSGVRHWRRMMPGFAQQGQQIDKRHAGDHDKQQVV